MARILTIVGMIGMLMSAAWSFAIEDGSPQDSAATCVLTSLGDVASCD